MDGGDLLHLSKATVKVKVKAKAKIIKVKKFEMLRIAWNTRISNKNYFPIQIIPADLVSGPAARDCTGSIVQRGTDWATCRSKEIRGLRKFLPISLPRVNFKMTHIPTPLRPSAAVMPIQGVTKLFLCQVRTKFSLWIVLHQSTEFTRKISPALSFSPRLVTGLT